MECFHVFNISPALLNENYSATVLCACKENYLIKNLKSALFLKIQGEMLNKHKPVLSEVCKVFTVSVVFSLFALNVYN